MMSESDFIVYLLLVTGILSLLLLSYLETHKRQSEKEKKEEAKRREQYLAAVDDIVRQLKELNESGYRQLQSMENKVNEAVALLTESNSSTLIDVLAGLNEVYQQTDWDICADITQHPTDKTNTYVRLSVWHKKIKYRDTITTLIPLGNNSLTLPTSVNYL